MRGTRLAVRVLLVGASALVTGAALVVFFAWLALHVEWEIPDPAGLTGPTTVRAEDGTVLTRFTSEVDRRVVPLDHVSDEAIRAIIASEDARFYEHRGVDPFALLRAVVRNVRTGAIEQGGSTLTQQYVKNAFTSGDRTIVRKVREAVISIQLERELSKDQILENYVNTVYFGEGAYGIEAAALTYFGVGSDKLNANQGATLAQLLPGPSARNPRADPEGARARRNAVLARMQQLGMLEPHRVRKLSRRPVEVRKRERRETPHAHFVAHVRKQLEAAYGEERVLTGALDVRTTLRTEAQKQLEAAVETNLPLQEDDPTVDAGAVAIDPATGAVTAMYGGRDFTRSQVNLATQGHFLVGSTFKPVVFAAALEQGVSPDRTYSAPASITIADWRPQNYDRRGHGAMTIREALVDSVNTVYAQLGRDVGGAAIGDLLHRMGVRNPLSADRSRPPPVTIALGAPDVVPSRGIGPTVLDVGSVFATFANSGLRCPAHTIIEVRGRDGSRLRPPQEGRPGRKLLDKRADELKEVDTGGCYGAVDRDIALTTTEVLEDVVDRGTGRRADIGRPQAGKTGTTNDSTDAWFAGYTPQLALTVWIGHRDGISPLEGVRGAGRTWSSLSGGTIPALIWKDAATAMLKDVEPVEFPEPGALTESGRLPGPPMGGGEPAGPTPAPGPSASASPGTDGPGDGPSEPFLTPSPGQTGSEPDDGDDGGDDDDGGGGGGGGGACVPPVITSGCSEPPA